MRGHNSTIKVKKKICIGCNSLQFIFSKGRCQQCSKVYNANKEDAEEQDAIEAESWSNLRDDCDQILSLVIRHKNSDVNGICTCFTCGKHYPIGQMTNGHYISRSNLSTRFLEDNCAPQCQWCNSKHETDIRPFKNALEKEKPGITQWLEKEGRKVYKPSISDLKEILATLKYRYNLVKKIING